MAIKSKPDRATPLRNGILDEIFFLDIRDPELLEAVNDEFRGFPDMVHDDIIDAIAYGFIKLRRPSNKRMVRSTLLGTGRRKKRI